MSKSILIQGLPASGKTVSLRNLDIKSTFYINADGKTDQWKGFSNSYNKKNKNYMKTKDSNNILAVMQQISDTQPHIKTIVVDTINSVMVNMEMKSKASGFNKWSDIAEFGYSIIDLANNLRDDLNVILVGHTAIGDEGFETLVTNGRKLEKINLTAYCSVVLLAKHEDEKYKFIVRSENSSARVPFGYFTDSDELDNDILLVLKELES